MKRRLDAIINYIRDGIGTIDVGTDHAYLPVALARRGYRGEIYASDVKLGPLQAAKRSAEAAGVSERIRFLLCDGLDQCDPSAVDTIVIAGMGGDTICGILDRAEWTMDPLYTMILQPMTKAEVLRYWLSNNEYAITQEELVSEAGKLYQILVVRFGQHTKLSDAELFTGAFDKIAAHPLCRELLTAQVRRFSGQLDGLRAEAPQRHAGRQEIIQNILDQLKEMMDHVDGT